ncbi:hypothetical protein ACOL7R_19565 (plasmid) [Acinetobacter pittii]|jgi:flagellar biosynthesis/type III secretory pathway protein FliH|uniref:hypothetical protein n=1 Tax=Acinetobacter TaxID=469 RepID=UPI0015B3E4F3|nr:MULTISPECIES: hypothetical protein [Acinetobacter]MBT0888487.1 hypothetical protein [Acinetobacter towneri]NWJ93891.1 hypothetical protein [Acinetobacter sp. Swhac1]
MKTPQQNDITPVEQQKKLTDLMQQVYEIGIAVGYEAGYADGRKDEKENMKAAISDGTRNKSSECGKKLNEYKQKKK